MSDPTDSRHVKAEDDRSVLAHLIGKQAYTHPHFGGVRFQSSLICPNCSCEFTVVIKQEPSRKTLCCQNCGAIFKENENLVA